MFMTKKNPLIKLMYFAFLAFFLFIIIYSLSKGESFYVFDSFLFMGLATILYFSYNKLNMNWLSFLLINIVMSMHELGRFGFFGMQFFGVNYDLIMHFFSAFVLANIYYFALIKWMNLKEKHVHKILLVIVLLLCLGTSVLGEFLEFGGEMFIRGGQGFLGVEPELVSDSLIGVNPATYNNASIIESQIVVPQATPFDNYYDTLTDLLANACGAIISLILIQAYYVFSSPKSKKRFN